MNPLQLKLLDLFWMTGLAACLIGAITTGAAEIALGGLCGVLLFVWRRPVLLRFWSVSVVGIGAGLFMVGYKDGYAYGLASDYLAGWGAGLLIGGAFAYYVFELRKPAA